MIEKLPEILETWLADGQDVALARVVKTWGSSPRPVGSTMLISSTGKIAGSVSGGCVEGAVAKKAKEVLESGESITVDYGVSDEDAWSVGLSCGGSLTVYIQKIVATDTAVWKDLIDAQKQNRSAILISSLEDGSSQNALVLANESVVGDTVPKEVVEEAKDAYRERAHRFVSYDQQAYFIQVFPRKPQLLIIGAAHIAVDLVALGKQYGFETIVIDPRGYFAENTTFSVVPDQLIQTYPSEALEDFALDAYTFCAILSHDPKIDDDALQLLLPSEVAYIGALGSRKNQEKRRTRMIEKGFSQEQIDRIHGPIGANINARSAGEIALSIMAQIIEVKNENLFKR